MPRIKVDVMGINQPSEQSLPIIEVKADHKINIVRFINGTHKFNWELVATPKEENHEQDVFDYFEQLKKRFETKGFVEFIKPKLRFLINKEKRTVFLQLKDKKISIKCDEEDKFDWKVGLGLAISNLNDNSKYKEHREFFRNKKTRELDYKKYAKWVLNEFYGNDMFDLENLESRVKNAKDKEFIEL